MNQTSPGRMAGKPASRAARKPGLEIAFDPDADPPADLTPDPFATGEDGLRAPPGPAADAPDGTGVREAATRRPPRPAAAAADPPAGAPAGGQASAAPEPARHADPAEAARALGIPLPLAKIEVTVSVEVGRTRLSLADLVSVEPGELVALDRMTTAPVDILVNGKPFARGEIVAIGERFGVRLTELLDPGEPA